VAPAGLGEDHQARWLWGLALELFPDVATLDLDRYGEIVDPLQPPFPDQPANTSQQAEGSGIVTPPERVKQLCPTFRKRAVCAVAR
jgi:hypothetical protein